MVNQYNDNIMTGSSNYTPTLNKFALNAIN